MANYSELFGWWTAMISWSIAFLVMVSIYLYHKRRRDSTQESRPGILTILGRFEFVWVLAGLLIIYIVSIKMASSLIFALGNVAVELILITYIMRNKTNAG